MSMKICILTATYPYGESYGGVFIQDQALMFQKMGFDVSVLYSSGSKSISSLNERVVKCVRVESIEVFINRSFRFADTYTVPLLRVSIEKSSLRLYEAYCEKYGNADIIIAHFSYPAGIGALKIREKYNVPVIIVEHLSLFLDIKARPWLNPVLKRVSKCVSSYVFVSDRLRISYIKRLGIDNNCQVIPNVIDHKFSFSPSTAKDKFIFLCVGSLREIKNHSLLVNAFAKAFQDNESVELRIVGDGPLKSELEDLISRLEMNSKIILVGGLTRKELINEYKNCNCFVLLSKNETFGIAYREAMAVGRPIISSDNIGVNIGWEDSFGLKLSDLSVESVIDSLVYMFRHSNEYDGKYISSRTLDVYSEESVGRKYKSLFDKILERNTLTGSSNEY